MWNKKKIDAIEAIYKSLNQEIKKTDITEVMKKLQDYVGQYIEIKKEEWIKLFLFHLEKN